jgi:protein-S-isoprenylcysteine O-methyltransferase Ste14
VSADTRQPTLASRAAYLLRHMLAVLALPVTVTVAVPAWIARRAGVQVTLPSTASDMLLASAGIPVLMAGLILFASSLYEFFVHGRGTLAPWDPPRRLLVRGPYRYVRNPMISGVAFVLCGTALMLRSRPHAMWAVIFVLINATYISLLEEPGLEARFGEEYARYKRHVRRFLPRLTPWDSDRP